MWYGLASSTRASYAPVAGSFVAFCRVRAWSYPYFPAPAERVSVWIAHEARRIVTRGGSLYKKTLKRRLQALASWHKDLGLDTYGVVSPRVERVIAGANRLHGLTVRRQPLPITLPILRKIVNVIRSNTLLFGGEISALALVAALTLGFACFMRMGELTYSSFNERFDLGRASVAADEKGWPTHITIPSSKTDPFRMGVTTTIPRGPVDVCPARALRRYMTATFSRQGGPLFHLNGRPFTRSAVIRYMSMALMEAGYPAKEFSGHSLRRGAATWASLVGMTSTQIKTLGRWNSDCYKLYIDAGPEAHLTAGLRLLHATSDESSLPASGIPEQGQVWRPALE